MFIYNIMEQSFEHHAIANDKIIDKLINASELNDNNIVLEIGPGNGVITKELCKIAKKVIVIEKDLNCKERLNKLLDKYDNLEIIYANVLDIKLPFFDNIVANIPFNIAEPLIYKLIKVDFNCAIFIIGKDFVNNLISLNTESRVSIIANCYFNTKIVCVLNRNDFDPEPRTIPKIVKITKRQKQDINDQLIYFLRDLFDQKDKRLKNALVESIINNKFNKGEKLTQRIAKEKVRSLDLDNKILEKSILLISNQELNDLIKKLKELLCK